MICGERMNNESWNNKYNISNNKNLFLSIITNNCRVNRPKVNSEQKYTIYISEENSTIQLWIRSTGCYFSKQGSCTMCDYWIGDKLDTPHLIVEKALLPYKNTYTTLIFNTCGSPLDEGELSFSEQEAIWKVINQMGFSVIIIETHAFTVTQKKLECLKRSIQALIVIEMGLESSNDDVLLYCLNKRISLDSIITKTELVHEYSMKCCVNILLGAPFLSTKDRMADCINSIRDVLRVGVDTCAVFPVNIKEYTLVKLLYEQRMYNRVLGRELVEVLNHFSEEELSRINIAWAKERRQNNKSYKGQILGPYFCSSCKDTMFSLLETYAAENDGKARRAIVTKMMDATSCCKVILENRIENDEPSSSMIEKSYEYLLRNLLLNECKY